MCNFRTGTVVYFKHKDNYKFSLLHLPNGKFESKMIERYKTLNRLITTDSQGEIVSVNYPTDDELTAWVHKSLLNRDITVIDSQEFYKSDYKPNFSIKEISEEEHNARIEALIAKPKPNNDYNFEACISKKRTSVPKFEFTGEYLNFEHFRRY